MCHIRRRATRKSMLFAKLYSPRKNGQIHESRAPTHLPELRQRVFWSNGVLSGVHAPQGSCWRH
jgi:hypothetical protein